MSTQHNLTLDPQMEGQLEQFEIQQDKVQPYLDHRKKLPKFMDLRVDYAFKYILGHRPLLLFLSLPQTDRPGRLLRRKPATIYN